jgi:hypothetical protein
LNASPILDPLRHKEDFVILGDLGANSAELAVACEEAGASGVVLHLNETPSHGLRFGGLEIELDSLKECLSILRIPAGISIGDSRPLLREEWETCVALGFSFVNMFAHHMPTFVWKDERIAKFVSIASGYILEQVKAISEFPEVEGLVSCLTPATGYGLSLNLFDVATLRLISGLSKKPVLYSAQRKIRPEDISILFEQGCRGLLVMPSIFGATTKGEYKHSIELLKSSTLSKIDITEQTGPISLENSLKTI